MATLEENINQAIADFDDIEAAIEEQGIDVPVGTDTSEYGNLIRSLAKSPIKYVESDSSNPVYLRDMESGTYILYGKFKPFNGSTGTFTFSTGMLVSIQKATAMTYVQVFYSKNNTIQYLEITDEAYTRKDAKLVDMETKANLTTTVDENSDDEHYPSAKAVYDFIAQSGTPIKILESLDKENIMSMRDITDGYYIMTGYFHPYPNSKSTIIVDGLFTSVARRDAGSHIMTISPLNFKITCYEILVDDTVEDGFTYTKTTISLLDLYENAKAMVTTIDETSDDAHYPSAKATYTLFNTYSEQVNALLETIVNGEETASE